MTSSQESSNDSTAPVQLTPTQRKVNFYIEKARNLYNSISEAQHNSNNQTRLTDTLSMTIKGLWKLAGSDQGAGAQQIVEAGFVNDLISMLLVKNSLVKLRVMELFLKIFCYPGLLLQLGSIDEVTEGFIKALIRLTYFPLRQNYALFYSHACNLLSVILNVYPYSFSIVHDCMASIGETSGKDPYTQFVQVFDETFAQGFNMEGIEPLRTSVVSFLTTCLRVSSSSGFTEEFVEYLRNSNCAEVLSKIFNVQPPVSNYLKVEVEALLEVLKDNKNTSTVRSVQDNFFSVEAKINTILECTKQTEEVVANLVEQMFYPEWELFIETKEAVLKYINDKMDELGCKVEEQESKTLFSSIDTLRGDPQACRLYFAVLGRLSQIFYGLSYGCSVVLKGETIELPSSLSFGLSDVASNMGKIEKLSEQCAWQLVQTVWYKFQYSNNAAVDDFAEKAVKVMLEYMDLKHGNEDKDIKYSIDILCLLDKLSTDEMIQYVLNSGIKASKSPPGLLKVKFVSRGRIQAIQDLKQLTEDIKKQDKILLRLASRYADLKYTLSELQGKHGSSKQ